ncbi:MAG: acyl-CoA thioesterase [Bacteroidia bacterium]
MLTTPITVRGYHCDAYGHVNNARYLEFYEEARWNFLQPAIDDGSLGKLDILFVVVNIEVSYKQAIVPNDQIEVHITNVSFNNSSIVIEQEIRRGSVLCSEAKVHFVLMNKMSQKPIKITDEVRDIFNHLNSTK